MKKINLIILGLTSLIFSQGFLVQKDQNAIWGNGGIEFADGAIALGPTVGYTVKGIFDLAITYAHTSDEESSLDFAVNTFGGSVSFLPSNLIENTPLGTELNASYGFSNFSGDFFDEVDASARSLGLGAGVYKNFKLDEKFEVVPSFNFTFVMLKSEVEFGTESVTDNDNFNVFTLSNTFAYSYLPATKVYVTPRFTISDGDNSFGLYLGITKLL